MTGLSHKIHVSLRRKIHSHINDGLSVEEIKPIIRQTHTNLGACLDDAVHIVFDSFNGISHRVLAEKYDCHSLFTPIMLEWLTDNNDFTTACPSSNETSLTIPTTVQASSLGTDAIKGIRISGTTGKSLGRSIATGDINGDGFIDIVIGTPSDGRGKVYVIYGQAITPASIDATTLSSSGKGIVIQSNTGSFNKGFSVAVGDINGDGFDDIAFFVVRNPGWVIFGGNNLPSSIEISDIGSTISGIIIDIDAINVAMIDTNKDGFADLIAPNPVDEKIYILFGADSMPSSITTGDANVQLTGIIGDSLGPHTASPIGDVNGDGIQDIFFNQENGKQAFIVFGKISFPTIIDMSQIGTVSNTDGILIDGSTALGADGYFRFPGQYSGDFNNDGNLDIIIGSRSNEVGELGKAWIIYGPLTSNNNNIDISNIGTMGNTEGVRINGITADLLFGTRTMFLDVNNDGIDDAIISATPSGSGETTPPGEIYVIFGHSSPTETIDLTTLGSGGIKIQGEYSYFGTALEKGNISCAGILNLIAGSPGLGISDEAVYAFFF